MEVRGLAVEPVPGPAETQPGLALQQEDIAGVLTSPPLQEHSGNIEWDTINR